MFDLETLARAELGELENVSFNFMGEVENKEAKAFFLNNAVDFFINTSESGRYAGFHLWKQ
ncbi:Uncharacterised protein [Pseudomonas aeruginosa]|nr:Uncharacterised protein [Pseudomonas aeruginosa]